MRALWPYLALYKRHKWLLLLGIVLAIVTLLASIGLLTLSGWFLSASAVVGVAGIYSFNYMLPAAGVRARRSFAPLAVILSVWSAMTQPFASCSICGYLPSANCYRSPPPGWRVFVRVNCLTGWLQMSIPWIISICASYRRW